MVEKALEERLRCIMKTYAEKKWGDCSKAVAYQFNFVKLVYGYPPIAILIIIIFVLSASVALRKEKIMNIRNLHFPKTRIFIFLTRTTAVCPKN